MQEETDWITQAKEGNQRAFRSLYDANVAALYRFLRQFTSRSGDVDEWVQRAFVKAFQGLASFDGRSRFSTWLHTLAINEMRMDLRRARILPFVPNEETEGLAGEPADFEWHLTMKSWMSDLDETKRAVFVLYEVEGYSHAEIGSMLGIAESSSRTYLARAKRYLQSRWIEEKPHG